MITHTDSPASASANDQHVPARGGVGIDSAGSDSRGASRLAERVVEDVLKDWEAHGAQVVAAVRQERPHEFLKLVIGLFPKEKDVKEDRLDALTDEQLAGQLASVLARLAGTGIGPGEET